MQDVGPDQGWLEGATLRSHRVDHRGSDELRAHTDIEVGRLLLLLLTHSGHDLPDGVHTVGSPAVPLVWVESCVLLCKPSLASTHHFLSLHLPLRVQCMPHPAQ